MPSSLITTLSSLLHLLLAAYSAYAGYNSYLAIVQLQKYESTSEKAAKVLDKAKRELDETRKTHALGAGAILLSFLASMSFSIYPPSSAFGRVFLYLLVLAATWFAKDQMSSFWEPKREGIPVVPDGYERGIALSKITLRSLGTIWWSWLFLLVAWVFLPGTRL